LPLILVEREGGRTAMAVKELQKLAHFWVIDGQLFRSAEHLIREASSSASLGAVIDALGVAGLALPIGSTVCDVAVHSPPFDAVFQGKEVDVIRIDKQQRRLDMRWSTAAANSRWRLIPREMAQRFNREWVPIRIGVGGVNVEGRSDETAVRSFGMISLLPETPLAEFLLSLLETAVRSDGDGPVLTVLTVASVISQRFQGKHRQLVTAQDWKAALSGPRGEDVYKDIDFDRLTEVMRQENFVVFDASAWIRKDGESL
jgi:hypothetical protein